MKLPNKTIITLLILKILLIGVLISMIKLNEIKNYLPLPVKMETKQSLSEQKDYLDGDPFKIQLWLNQNITGKRDIIQYAQSPEETFDRKSGDCDDYATIAKYFLEVRYNEIYLIVWEGNFLPESKNYEKDKKIICHCICLFKIKENMWGIMDNNGFVIAKGTLEEAVQADVYLRYVSLERAFIVRFYRYVYKIIRKLNLEEIK